MNGMCRDRWIKCIPEGIEIRGYYFPWGTSSATSLAADIIGSAAWLRRTSILGALPS